MSTPRIGAGLLLALALALAIADARVVRAAEIEYAVIHRALGAAGEVAAYPRLRAVQRIESKRDGVAPRAIGIAIRARRGRIEVPVGDDGTIALPLDDALLAENPVVETNQPEGSLTLTISVELHQPSGAIVRTADVETALTEADALLVQQRARSRVRGVEFRFADDETGGVTLRGSGERVLVPDREGRVIVMREPDLSLYREIELAARPIRILPFLDQ
ncbi:MAG TPA: hypothetical protein VND91_03760 [Candidatus Saccharimonadia bacterium]|nr:hypothetical protein [Candidatus Saccharimonadia bacterium]